MRILWVKVGGLWPLNTGGRLRSFHTISELSRRHPVTLLTTHGPEEDPAELALRLPHCDRVQSFPHRPPKRGSLRLAGSLVRSWLCELPMDLWKWRVAPLRREVERLFGTGQVDLCVADFMMAVPNVPLGGQVPVVLFQHNVEHMIWKRLACVERLPWRQLLLELEWRKMRRLEAKTCGRCAMTLAVSEEDRAVLAETSPSATVRSVPTGVDTSYFVPDGSAESAKSLVFSGSMDWYPNEDGMLHFLAAILPRIRREAPEAGLTIVGRGPTPRLLSAAAAAGARVTGRVDDVRSYMGEGAVYVVPLRVGGGTRLKIFEALAMGKAVVSTTVGAEGLPLTPGEHFIVADDPASFASAVVSLLRDPGRRRALGAAGRQLVEARYSWPQVAREFESHLEAVCRRDRGETSLFPLQTSRSEEPSSSALDARDQALSSP
jgi:glycosyltransferase involved in cell wall biosynthesis